MKTLATISMTVLTVLATMGFAQSARAEARQSFCGYIPDSPLQTSIMTACTYSRNREAIEINWEEGDIYTRFEAVDEKPGTYIDQGGGIVYAQRSHVGADAQFRLERGTVLVYWQAPH
ncbi:MAG: hypothetical protein AAGC93_30175 [Cyanobacteria bacterium P01_F01_bin.53]